MAALGSAVRASSRQLCHVRTLPFGKLTTTIGRGLSVTRPERRDNDRDEDRVRHCGIVRRINDSIFNNIIYSNVSIRRYHATPREERGAAIVLSLGAIAATAKAGQYAVQGYNEWRKQRSLDEEKLKAEGGGKEAPSEPRDGKASADAPSGSCDDTAKEDGRGSAAGEKGKTSGNTAERENIFSSWFNVSVGSKYYEGGFEEKMTRKEAALILGVRESSTAKRIKEAHRKLLILNHPDTGGSTYISGKVNEAKELLLQGKRQ